MSRKGKKRYKKPNIARVKLTVEEQVLSCCKTSSAVNPAASKRLCNTSQCPSTPANLS